MSVFQGTGASESLQGEDGIGRNPLDKFVRQMALIREATITPSGMDEELRFLPTAKLMRFSVASPASCSVCSCLVLSESAILIVQL